MPQMLERNRDTGLRTLLVIVCLALVGCVGMGPKRVPKDRYNYGESVGDSAKVQSLLAIVKMRYMDWPTFLEIDQIAAAYTWNTSGSLNATIRSPFGSDNDQLGANIGGSVQERPTVILKPVGGQAFVETMLTPIRPEVLLSLVEAGSSAEGLMETMLLSVNGKYNLRMSYGAGRRPDEAFIRFVRLVKQLQLENAISFRSRVGPVAESAETSNSATTSRSAGTSSAAATAGGVRPLYLRMRTEVMSPESRKEAAEVKKLLGLDPDLDDYLVAWGSYSEDPSVIAMQTRSVLGFMGTMSWFVDVPEIDLERGYAMSLEAIPENPPRGARRMMKVRSGKDLPDSAYVAVRYSDHWFWIDRADNRSKSTFAYLSMLLTVTEGGSSGGAPLVLTVN